VTVLLGALLESFVTIIILGPLLLPVALQLGINPLQYGIIMVEAFGIGSILPPIGIALYVASAICGTKVERASGPLLSYLAVMLIGLLLVCFIPWITLALPALFDFRG
jgi:TRAP-type C4-dicarboxylate transport system permease large subunit